jgi:uncharacterized protein (DUF1919 family)
MSIFTAVSNKIKRSVMYLPRKKYYSEMQGKLLNKTPSIISSDCFGGIACHNLGIQFRTPTVNLYFSKEQILYHFFK